MTRKPHDYEFVNGPYDGTWQAVGQDERGDVFQTHTIRNEDGDSFEYALDTNSQPPRFLFVA